MGSETQTLHPRTPSHDMELLLVHLGDAGGTDWLTGRQVVGRLCQDLADSREDPDS